jgi:hypothetical protein
MKKQINPTIKAYLLRGAFYLLLLIAVCAIPFALAQRNTGYRNVTRPAARERARRTCRRADAHSYTYRQPDAYSYTRAGLRLTGW